MNDLISRIILAVVLIAALLIRAYYTNQARQAVQEDGVTLKESRQNELFRLALRYLGYAILGVAIFVPSLLAWAAIPLPQWLRWLGAGLGVVSVFLLWWVQHALGRNFSNNLHVLGKHQLVTHGPYRWVRHPMYDVFYLLAVTFFLVSANVAIGLLWFVVVTYVVASRLDREEQVMIETFGDQYRTYMKRTGRMLPRVLPAEND